MLNYMAAFMCEYNKVFILLFQTEEILDDMDKINDSVHQVPGEEVSKEDCPVRGRAMSPGMTKEDADGGEPACRVPEDQQVKDGSVPGGASDRSQEIPSYKEFATGQRAKVSEWESSSKDEASSGCAALVTDAQWSVNPVHDWTYPFDHRNQLNDRSSVGITKQQGYASLEGMFEKPAYKPEIFDGSEDWYCYIRYFEWCAEINGWSDWEKANYLKVSCGGTARQVLADINQEDLRSFQDVVKVLEKRFDPVGRSQVLRLQLRNRRREEGESLGALADDIKRLVERIFPDLPESSREMLAKDYFVGALTDEKMNLEVVLLRPRSLAEALDAAMEYEFLRQAEEVRDMAPSGTDFQRVQAPCVFQDAVKRLKEELNVETLNKDAENQARDGVDPMVNKIIKSCGNCGDTSHELQSCTKWPGPFYTKAWEASDNN